MGSGLNLQFPSPALDAAVCVQRKEPGWMQTCVSARVADLTLVAMGTELHSLPAWESLLIAVAVETEHLI